ncbi:MAG: shikimate kinase [Proteobacteria bacterium]|nr:shikimate kinase [Pseudomonadota bacterium]
MNIVLIGYRGTGKTAVGKELSHKLSWPLFQLDAIIVEHEGCSIPAIVEQHGWNYFRDREAKLLQEVAAKDTCIIDTGGGVVLRQENIDRLKKNGILFLLTADPETITGRIQDNTNRPSLTSGKSFTEEVAEVLQQRLPLYMKAQDFTIDTGGKTIDAIADEIVKLFNKRVQKVENSRVPE